MIDHDGVFRRRFGHCSFGVCVGWSCACHVGCLFGLLDNSLVTITVAIAIVVFVSKKNECVI